MMTAHRSATVDDERQAANTISVGAGPQERAGDARIAWLDASRGVGIVLVVVGHVLPNPTVHHLIFLFHMPLFFMLSGFMYSSTPWSTLSKRRFHSLAVPYFFYLVVISLLDSVLCSLDGVEPSLPLNHPREVVLRLIAGGSFLHDSLGVMWFVPCLLLANLLYGAVDQIAGALRVQVLCLLSVSLAAIAYLVPIGRLPLAIDVVPLATTLFWAGHRLRQIQPIGGLLLFFIAIGAAIFTFFSFEFDMKYHEFGLWWANLSAAMLIPVLFLEVIKRLNIGPVRATFAALGRSALVIMFTHKLLQVHLEQRLAPWLVVIVALGFGWGITRLSDRAVWSRKLLLGQR